MSTTVTGTTPMVTTKDDVKENSITINAVAIEKKEENTSLNDVMQLRSLEKKGNQHVLINAMPHVK